MPRYVSFLRGTNVGGRSIKMTDLKSCYEKAGFSQVSTLLQSGNVIFTSNESSSAVIGARLEQAVGAHFNYPAKILVLQQSELGPLLDAYPFDSSDKNYQHYILFVRPGLVDDLVGRYVTLDPSIEQVAPGNGVVYWQVLKGWTLKSPFAKVLTKPQFKDFHTSRNINTVRKLISSV
jgi:uncharacterized protein (DUF1697 family)